MTATRTVISTDGTRLAVYESGRSDGPTIVAVHGYPDNHTVWDGVVAQLSDRFRVVTYDVRGAGRSERPRATSAYKISQLVDDLGAVLDVVSPEQPVHLLAHDWGSIQTWDAVTDERFADRLHSFTSISGPSLDAAAVWLRRAHRHPRKAIGQLLDSYYIAIFQLPWLPEAIVRAGIAHRVVALSSTSGTTTAAPHVIDRADARDGVKLYRANFASRLARPRPGRTRVPVQVIAPTHDLHVSSALQTEAPVPYVERLVTREIEGNHWVVAQRPEVVARLVEEFIAYVDGSTVPSTDVTTI